MRAVDGAGPAAEPVPETPGAPASPAGLDAGRAMLARAQWAARAFAGYDADTVLRLVRAAAGAAAAAAEELARDAVAETGYGVVEDKVRKNLARSSGLVEACAGQEYVTPRVDGAAGLVRVPRPVGVVLAATPATSPVSTVFVTVLLALLTRNAVLIVAHPRAAGVSSRATAVLARAARAAGAPDGCVQWLPEPSEELWDALAAHPGPDLVLHADRGIGGPGFAGRPGSAPVLVEAGADLALAARCIVDSASFDNSLLDGSEGVVVVHDAAAAELLDRLADQGAHLLDPDGCDRLRAALFPGGTFDRSFTGCSAATVAARAGVRVPGGTRVLLAPFPLAVPDEVLAHATPCPVLGVVRVATAARGIEAAQAVLRIGGAARASIHSADPQAVLDLGAAVRGVRVAVNARAGLDRLAPPASRSTLTEALDPEHLVRYTALAWGTAEQPVPPICGLPAGAAPTGPVPAYPYASNDPRSRGSAGG